MKVGFCQDSRAWDAYVAANAHARNYHRWCWKDLIESTYGHSTFYLAAQEGERICAVLPLVGLKSWLWGRCLVSMPFFSYGGVLADTPEAGEQLMREAESLAHDWNADYIELRQGQSPGRGWQASMAKVSMSVPLLENSEKFFASLSSRLRNKIRSAQKQGLLARWGTEELVKDFYKVFSCNMRNLGTPVYPRAWFENFLRVARDTSKLLVLYDGQEPVAGTLITAYRDQAEMPWIASTPVARGKYSTVFLYWTALEWAAQSGFRRVDLGRCSPGSGTHRFKTQWNCQEIPLPWVYWVRNGGQLPQLRADNPRFRLAVGAWKRLPLVVANVLGPRIVRAIP
jgi:serine/alanine adding enzyme